MTKREEAIRRAVGKITPETIDEMVAVLKTPISLEPRTGNWMSAREARLFISHEAQVSLKAAEKSLCRRALCWIPLRVGSFARGENPHEGIDRIAFFEHNELSLTHFKESPLPSDWSEVREMFDCIQNYEPFICRNGVHYADWATGDFKVTIEKDFSSVTLEITGLQFDRHAVAKSIGVSVGLDGQIRGPISDADLAKWIAACKTENSKEAWQQLRAEFGASAPKREEVFLPTWRTIKGQRRKGRPSKSPA